MVKLDKRAALGEFPVIVKFLSYALLIAVLLIGLPLASNVTNNIQKKITGTTQDIGDSIFIVNFMRTPVDIPDSYSLNPHKQQVTMAELIALWYGNDAYKDLVKLHTDNIINDFYQIHSEWTLEVSGQEKIMSITQKEQGSIPIIDSSYKLLDSSIELPVILTENKDSIGVTLIVRTKNVEPDTWCFHPSLERPSRQGKACTCKREGFSLLWKCEP